MLNAILAVSIGSAAGGLLRWSLSSRLNHFLPALPLGTLISNLVAGYLVGIAIAYFAVADGIAPEWRLLLITGFCGGLSTFSTFSAEIVTLLQQGRWSMACAAIAVHVIGSVLMTFAGIASYSALGTR
jgi:CrcB protein